MEFEQALEIICLALKRPLTDVEVALLSGVWDNLSYDDIASQSGYSINYLQRDVGPKFWRLLSNVWGRQVNKTNLRAILTQLQPPPRTLRSSAQSITDWGEALDVSGFHGRVEEMETLTQWMIQDRCRLIALVGMGGIGKTALAAKVAQLLQEQFEFVIWRSLRNAPPLETLLSDLVPFLSKQQDIQAQPGRLLYWLQTHRCLVILDNQDTLLQAGDCAGYYQPHFANYGNLFRWVGEATHQSCILLTSREKSAEIAVLEDVKGAVRSLCLQGSKEAALALINAKQLIGTNEEKRQLCKLYRCNPLALKIVAASIQSLFDGEIRSFFPEETLVFNGIRRLLDQQFERLSPLEQTIMNGLAINREWTAIPELHADIVPTVSRARLLESLESLTWRSLIEKRSGEYTQQPVIMEYVTDCLIRQLVTELLTLELSSFNQYALIKTTVLDYIHQSQIRLILNPLIEQLQASFHPNSLQLEQHLQSLLSALRDAPESALGYGVGNFINLCLNLQIDLTGYDFSHLNIRHADLQGATLQQVNFQFAHFQQSTFTQYFSGVMWIGFSPDGRHFAITDTNGGLHIWEFKQMQPLITIQAHEGWICAVNWHPDGKMIVTSLNSSVKLWDTHTGQFLREFQGYNEYVFVLTWSPDGQQLAGGGREPFIQIWDGATGACLRCLGSEELNSQSVWIWSLVWLAEGTVLAAAYTDHKIRFWDMTSGECIQVIQAHENWVLALALHPNGRILASSGFDRVVKLWDWQTGECLAAIATQDVIWRLAWSGDGERLAGASQDCTVMLWDRSLGCLHVLQGHKSWVWGVAWSLNGQTLLSAAHDQVIKFWNPQTGDCVRTLQGYSNSCWCIKWSQDGIRLLISSTNRTVQLWNSQTGECIRLFRGHSKEVMSVAWSPDERLMASSSTDATLRLWDVETGRCLQVLQGHQSWVWSVVWSRDGNYLLSGSNDQTVRLWDANSGQCLLILADHTNYVTSAIYHPEGNWIASSSVDGTIRFWDLSRGVCDRIISVNRPVHCIAFSPDGKTLLSGDYHNRVQLWDVASGACLRTFQGHESGHTYSVGWCADGNTVASACSDLTVRIWDVSTGNCEQVIPGQGWGLSLDWNPINSQLLAIAFLEQPIQLWDIKTGEIVQTLKSPLPYEGMNIAGVTGISQGQKATLKALGALEASL